MFSSRFAAIFFSILSYCILHRIFYLPTGSSEADTSIFCIFFCLVEEISDE